MVFEMYVHHSNVKSSFFLGMLTPPMQKQLFSIKLQALLVIINVFKVSKKQWL